MIRMGNVYKERMKYLAGWCLFLLFATSLKAQIPSASFSAAVREGCVPLSVNFSNNSTGAASFYWDFGNGNFSTVRDPQNVYINAGTYTVTLVAISPNGQRDTLKLNNYILAKPGPEAAFSVDRTSGCVGETPFTFTNNSTGAVSYMWDFGDGIPSTATNPVKYYQTPGTRTVKLVASASSGCNSVYTLPQPVTAHTRPTASFTVNQTTACSPGQSFQFTAGVSGAAGYKWDFGDGTGSALANPAKVYNAAGTYSVTLIVTGAGGCADTIIKPDLITIHPELSPGITSNDSAGCTPFKPVIKSTITNATSYQWSSGGQTSQQPTFRPVYNETGSYPVTLTITMAGGCTYTRTEPNFIQVGTPPVANFSVSNSSGCAPITPVFNNTSTGGSTYLWNFGDNTTSTQANPSKTFTEPGSYNVKLEVTNAQGCRSSLTLPNSVIAAAPVASFTASQTMGCPPFETHFTNTSIDGTQYQWLFSDGTSTTEENPVKVFGTNGSYDVTLVAVNENGCRDTTFLSGYINVNYEQADYTPPAPVVGCAPLTASFDNSGVSGTSFLWDFGDGTTSTEVSPTHIYTDAGVFTVTLLVGDTSGCSQFYPVFQTIQVEGGIPLFIVDIDPCPPHAVHFRDTTMGAVAWYWEFGDNTTSTEQAPTHIYDDNEIHHVTLTATTGNGCTNTYIGFNAVNFSILTATFNTTYTRGSFPRSVQFESTNPQATSWFWDFGDGNTSTEENPTHVYEVEGNYEVRLIINSDSCELVGNGSPFADNVQGAEESEGEPGSGGSYPSDVFDLGRPLTGCAPITITFFPQDTAHQVVLWSFGDGNTATSQHPQNTYSRPGLYNVFYIANTPSGLDTFQYNQAILIGGVPPDFTIDQQDFCSHTKVDVQIVGQYPEITWSFPGIQLTSPSATHNFPVSNTSSNVLLTVKDTLGCQSSRLKSIYTNPPIPRIIYPTSICRDSVRFDQTLANPEGYSFHWEFGDGSESTEFEPVHFYSSPGAYKVKLTITDSEGCENELNLPDSIRVFKPVSNFEIIGPTSGCAPFQVSVANNSTGTYSTSVPYVWNWNINGSGTPQTERATGARGHLYTRPGVYSIQLIAENRQSGVCRDTFILTDAITVYGVTAGFRFEQEGECFPLKARFFDESEDAVSWSWDFGNGYTSTEQNPVMNFLTAPSDTFRLTITNSQGCSKTIEKRGLRLYTAQINADYTGICNPLQVSFSASATSPSQFIWNFGDGASANGAQAVHVYEQIGDFQPYVIAVGENGCRDTALISDQIKVRGPRADFHSPTPANCAPSIVEFFETSNDAVAWAWDFGDGSVSTAPNPVKLYERPGLYDVKLVVTSDNGCTDTLVLEDYVTVLGPATEFSMSPELVCEGGSVQFTDLSLAAVEWEWNFGEGNTSNEQNPVHQFDQPGTYTITLFSKDTLGCSAFYTIPTPLEVHPYPKARFTVSDTAACAPFTISTNNLSEGAASYRWSFNDIVSSSSFSPGFTFIQPGFYSVSLVATSAAGCSDTLVLDSLEAYRVPTAGFNLNSTEGCTPLSVSFNNTSFNTRTPVYSWNFGNGNTSSAINPTEVYYNPGSYDVSLVVTNYGGCSDSITLPAIVHVFDTLPAPVTPILRVSVEGIGKVLIEWERNPAPDFGYYRIHRKNNHTGLFEPIATIHDQNVLSYEDNGLETFENSYCYKLETADRCGYYTILDSLIEHCTINVETYTRTDNVIDVTWSPYVGKTPTQYRVLREQVGTGLVEDLGVVPPDVLSFEDSTVICPVSYQYSVKAEGLNSQAHVNSNSDYDVSKPIQNLFVNQRVDASRSTVVDNRFILTEWNPPTVMPKSIKGYKIYRSMDNVNWKHLTTVPSYQTAYIDEDVHVDLQKYYYKIMASNECGIEGAEGGFSDNIVLKASPLDAFKVQLDWSPYKGWGANGVGFYLIERETPDGHWEVILQVPGNSTSAVDEK